MPELRKWSPEEAQEKVDEIVDMIDEIESDDTDVYDKRPEMFDGIRETVTSIIETIVDRDFCSDKQRKAIENCGSCIRKWHPKQKKG